MKEVIIFIRPDRYYATKGALAEHRFFALSSKEVLGRGREHVHYEPHEGAGTAADERYERAFVAKRMIKIFVSDAQVDDLIGVVMGVNGTGSHGDGKIFVVPVESALRIHTGETGDDAVA